MGPAMTVTVYDDLEICNVAVTMIGASPINSIAEPVTDIEAACARLYPLVLGALMTHNWSFNDAVRQLVVDADHAAQFGFLYAYRLPSDLVSGPDAVYADGDTTRPVSDFANANDYIYADYERIDVRYRSNGSDPAIWPGYFIDLFTAALAARLAQPVRAKTDIQTEMRILAFGPADMDGKGGLWLKAVNADAKSKPMRSLFRNGDPLTMTRR